MRKVDVALIAPRRTAAPAGLMSAGRQLAAAVAALLMLVAAAITAAAEPRDADRPPGDRTAPSQVVPSLTWGSCGAGLEAFQCATAEVPSDYDDPAAGTTTTIALTRLPATAPSQRIGSLFLNFGGPGGPGVATLHALGGDFLAPSVRARFDVVGFDPRGVGASDPATCFRDAKQEAAFLSTLPAFPVAPEEEPGYIVSMAALGTSCTALSADRISVASTANVARDLDLLRAAVGDEKLTYLGYSYGTFLGATYAQLFPDRVRALTLDGTVLPEVWVGEGDDRVLTRRLGQHVATAEVYGEFLRLCKEAGPNGCALAALGDPGDVMETLLARLRAEPAMLPGPDGTPTEFGYDDAVAALAQTMYDPRYWTEVAAAFASLAAPPPAPQAETPDSRHRALGDLLRRLGLIEEYPSVGGAYASLCVDTEDPAGPLGYPDQADDAEREARHFGRLRVWATQPCAFIPVTDEDAYTGPWDQTTEEPVLVIGTRFDPATPYWATAPYAEHWPDARVLTVEGYGHTTIVPSTCASAAIATYLVELHARDGAVCRQDVRPFAPAPQDLDSRRAVPHLLGVG